MLLTTLTKPPSATQLLSFVDVQMLSAIKALQISFCWSVYIHYHCLPKSIQTIDCYADGLGNWAWLTCIIIVIISSFQFEHSWRFKKCSASSIQPIDLNSEYYFTFDRIQLHRIALPSVSPCSALSGPILLIFAVH